MEKSALHVSTYCVIIGIEFSCIDIVWEQYTLDDQNVVELGSNSTHTYFLLARSPKETLSEEDKVIMEADCPQVDAFLVFAKFIEIGEPTEHKKKKIKPAPAGRRTIIPDKYIHSEE